MVGTFYPHLCNSLPRCTLPSEIYVIWICLQMVSHWRGKRYENLNEQTELYRCSWAPALCSARSMFAMIVVVSWYGSVSPCLLFLLFEIFVFLLLFNLIRWSCSFFISCPFFLLWIWECYEWATETRPRWCTVNVFERWSKLTSRKKNAKRIYRPWNLLSRSSGIETKSAENRHCLMVCWIIWKLSERPPLEVRVNLVPPVDQALQ